MTYHHGLTLQNYQRSIEDTAEKKHSAYLTTVCFSVFFHVFFNFGPFNLKTEGNFRFSTQTTTSGPHFTPRMLTQLNINFVDHVTRPVSTACGLLFTQLRGKTSKTISVISCVKRRVDASYFLALLCAK